ncbi:DUF2512 family protein [Clostridium sp. DJ247]|uniref:DUF2512 family protein n=1 Tax=Clostridium sp. DJ247 TaxID=2726188 RepID=UPI001625E03C|nr:DUF2512 family protein [Clostridium sp. DJ247]MBC2581922.1 DUF2512 family protein [Clostridium sp. DJ247]
MTGLIMKIIICPLAVLSSDYLFTDVYFPYAYQAIVLGLILAVAAHVMELLFLKKGTFWINNVLDFIAAAVIVYVGQFFLTGARITFIGALLTSALLTITEYFQHLHLIRSGKTEKSE